MAAFIDDILVGTKNEKKHNEIVQEVLKRIEANNLYMKPKKYVQKVKEIDFLGLVIEVDGIKIQKEKVTEVLEQPRSKMVKDMQKFLELTNYYR